MAAFVAIDFETADHGRDSACSVGLVRVEDGEVTRKLVQLLRPPRASFLFSHIHGIRWSDVSDQPTFRQAWPHLSKMLEGAEFLAAHNASFDRGVLAACCAAAGLPVPALPFVCTVKVARDVWDIRPTKLDNVCERLDIELDHHEALSDAEACARILVLAQRKGFKR